MPVPLYSSTDYGGALQKHLPRGAAWPRETAATQTVVAAALGASFSRLNADANGVLPDAFPATAVNLLPEWEQTLALTASGTTSDRQAAVVAALQAVGGASVPYFIALAASLGFAITITTYRPSTCNDLLSRQLCGPDAAFRWTVTTTAVGSHTTLEATFRRLAPANTAVDFVYV